MKTMHLFDEDRLYWGSVSLHGDPDPKELFDLIGKAFPNKKGGAFTIELARDDPYVPSLPCQKCGRTNGKWQWDSKAKMEKFTCVCGNIQTRKLCRSATTEEKPTQCEHEWLSTQGLPHICKNCGTFKE